MEQKVKQIDLLDDRSEPVKEVIGQVPSWTIRWGTTVIFGFILALLLFTWFIKYPDIINSSIIITTLNPPVGIVAESDGKLSKIYVNEKEFVNKGQILASIDNPAHVEDALMLEKLLIQHFDSHKSINDFILEDNPDILNKKLKLGQLQKNYTDFEKQYVNLLFFKKENPWQKEITAIKRQLLPQKQLLRRQKSKTKLTTSELELVEKDFERNKILFDKDLISTKDIEDKKKEFLRMKSNFEDSKLGEANIEVKIAEYEANIDKLQTEEKKQFHQLFTGFKESLNNLYGSLNIWKQKYLLIAPIDGEITFFKYWSDNQYVNTGEEVMTVVPQKSKDIIGKVRMPIQKSGKVKKGQKVNIQIHNFPHREFGVIHGKVESISSIPRENSYAVEVFLPNGLLTSYNKQIDFRQEMKGNAEIITEDLRLIERIFYQIRTLFKY